MLLAAVVLAALAEVPASPMPPREDLFPTPLRVEESARIGPGSVVGVWVRLPFAAGSGRLWLITAEKRLLTRYGLEVQATLELGAAELVLLEVRNVRLAAIRLPVGMLLARGVVVASPSAGPRCGEPDGPQCVAAE